MLNRKAFVGCGSLSRFFIGHRPNRQGGSADLQADQVWNGGEDEPGGDDH